MIAHVCSDGLIKKCCYDLCSECSKKGMNLFWPDYAVDRYNEEKIQEKEEKLCNVQTTQDEVGHKMEKKGTSTTSGV